MIRTILSISLLLTGTSLSLHAAPVELVKEFSLTQQKYGSSFSDSYSVAVDNLGPTKQVFIHRQQKDGSWRDIPLSYSHQVGSNKEIWTGGTSYGLGQTGNNPDAQAFAVKYIVNGTTYWDNNNNQNYQVLAQGPLLGNGKNVVSDGVYLSNDANNTNKLANASIFVRNIGYAKQVKLVYSFNNWATSTVVNATYAGNPVTLGYGSYANPNANGIETWKANFQFPINQTNGKYYIQYTVNGQNYYDNNFGANYSLN